MEDGGGGHDGEGAVGDERGGFPSGFVGPHGGHHVVGGEVVTPGGVEAFGWDFFGVLGELDGEFRGVEFGLGGGVGGERGGHGAGVAIERGALFGEGVLHAGLGELLDGWWGGHCGGFVKTCN